MGLLECLRECPGALLLGSAHWRGAIEAFHFLGSFPLAQCLLQREDLEKLC